MTELVLHPLTRRAVDEYISRPAHALMLIGAPGSGKASVARHITQQLLGSGADNKYELESHPYVRLVRSEDGKLLPVETIRGLQQFLSLKIPGGRQGNIARIVIIEDAQLLSIESQNALLKTLEEPPADSVIILLVPAAEAVLATIRSRSRQLTVLPPGGQLLTEYFTTRGFQADAVSKALMLSGELPGLTQALLDMDESHPLLEATTHARGILRSKTYERLLLVDSLSKQKVLCQHILFVLTQMARMSLPRATDVAARRRWQKVLKATYAASEQLAHNTQTKLVLTNLMLDL